MLTVIAKAIIFIIRMNLEKFRWTNMEIITLIDFNVVKCAMLRYCIHKVKIIVEIIE